MKKKVYIAPLIEVQEIELVSMIASSTIKIGGDVDNAETDANKQHNSWGDIWSEKK